METFKLDIGATNALEISAADAPILNGGYISLNAGAFAGTAYKLKPEQQLDYIMWIQSGVLNPLTHRHPLFPNHDQIKLELSGGGEVLLDARQFGGIQSSAADPRQLDRAFAFSVYFKHAPMAYITEKCYNRLRCHLIDQNAILDLDEGDFKTIKDGDYQIALAKILARIECCEFELHDDYEEALDEIGTLAAAAFGAEFIGIGSKHEFSQTEEEE